MKKKMIHLIDDESIIHDIFKRIFQEPEFELVISKNKAQAKANQTSDFDVVIMDLMIPGSSGIEIFKELKKDTPDMRVIFLTAFGTIESAIEAIKLGALDYMQKPFNNAELKHKIDRVIKENFLNKENIQLKRVLQEKFSFDKIIGKSKVLLQTLNLVESVANSNSTVLITGESGTGKELIAKAIFQNSNRKNNPFFSFNSSNIPPTLFESLLFGYKKGAFTGAYNDKKGIFEEADSGTIFFDEIANLTAETQSKILRVIQEKEIQPLGSNKTIKVDVRIIAATNVDLKVKVEANEFRDDLYYRLNIINIHLPPLRDRKEDISLLAEHFLTRFVKENNKIINGFSPDYLHYLLNYEWPGNIRELENAVLRSVLLCKDSILTASTLPPDILEPRANSAQHSDSSFSEKVEHYKKHLIQLALEKHNWIQKKAAEELKLKPSTLFELMKRLDINK